MLAGLLANLASMLPGLLAYIATGFMLAGLLANTTRGCHVIWLISKHS